MINLSDVLWMIFTAILCLATLGLLIGACRYKGFMDDARQQSMFAIEEGIARREREYQQHIKEMMDKLGLTPERMASSRKEMDRLVEEDRVKHRVGCK